MRSSYAAPSKLTLAEFLNDEWLPAIKGTIRDLSFVQYEQVVRLRIVPRIGPDAAADDHGRASERALSRARRGGLSPSSRRITHAVLSRALRDAVRWGKVVRNPVDAADSPAIPESRATAWTAGELGRFLAHVAGDRLFTF